MTLMSRPGCCRSSVTALMTLSPAMSAVGAHVRSASDRVLDTTYFCTPLIQSANGSPARFGHAPAMTCHVRRP